MNEEIEQAETPEIEPASGDTRSIIEAAVAKQREEAPAEAIESVEADPVGDTTADEEKAASDRARDEKGRFAQKAGDEPAPVETAPEAEPDKPAEPVKAIRPPVGWPVAAKAEFDKLPAPVREAIARREEEVDKGFQKYGGLKPFVEEAEKYGTTLSEVVTRYRAVDRQLESDFLGGLDAIARQFRADPRSVAQAYAIRHGVSQAIGMTEQQQPPAYQQQERIDPNAIVQQVWGQFEEKQQQRETQTAIQAFAADPKNVFFENVRDDMATLLSTGKAESLEDAYDKACWLNPETRAFRIKEQPSQTPKPNTQAIQQAKQAAKAVGGAPSPGFNPGAGQSNANISLRDQIKAAVAAQR